MVRTYFPKTLSEALKILRDDPAAMPVAGGTDVMVAKKPAEAFIYISSVPEIKETCMKGQDLFIGAGEVYRDLLEEPDIPELLKAAMKEVASPAIRNAGTLAGNICNASPAGDTLPPLYCMDAEVLLSHMEADGSVKERRARVCEFITGIRKLDIRPGELVTAVIIPGVREIRGMKMYYEKVGARKSEAISKLSFAGLCKREEGDSAVADIRFAFGSVGITVVRRPEEEQKLKGLSGDAYREAADSVVKDLSEILKPIDDQRSTAKYRKQVSLNILSDFLGKAGEGSL
ncbi:MAG: FAD binding domain-containing protein [Lachnospiraceae bacterium]|nr:FAD binding domain-containing protein [Lachnospiraceae bacterium]